MITNALEMEGKSAYHRFNFLAHFCEVFRTFSSKVAIEFVTCK